jgi:hypothetical protein
MANKTARKLGVKKETLRQLTGDQLRLAAGGLVSSVICEAANESGRCGSTTIDAGTRVIIGYDAYGRPIYQISG